MSSALIAVLGTLAGAIVGGLIHFFANRQLKHHEWKLSLARDKIGAHQKLYAELLVECNRMVVEAMEAKIRSPRELNAVSGKIAEITLVANDEVIECAKKIASYVLDRHSQTEPNKDQDFFAMKQDFIHAARKEMAALANP